MTDRINMDEEQFSYAHYEQWKRWDEYFQYTADRGAYFEGETRRVKIEDADVLELGFGSGEFLQWALDHGARVAGTEVNSVLEDAAKERKVEILDPSLTSAARDHAGRFDTIVAFDVLEHLSTRDLLNCLRSIEQLLKPGGHLLARFPNSQSPFGLVPQNGDLSHRSALCRGVIEQMVENGCLEVVHYRGQFQPLGRSPATIMVRSLRRLIRAMIAVFLNVVFATEIPYDPVVSIVVRKADN